MANNMATWPMTVKANWPIDEIASRVLSIHMTRNDFRSLVIDALARTGMSVAELSRRSGVTYDAINKLKRRENSSTSAENAKAIADVLSIDWASDSPDVSPAAPADPPRFGGAFSCRFDGL